MIPLKQGILIIALIIFFIVINGIFSSTLSLFWLVILNAIILLVIGALYQIRSKKHQTERLINWLKTGANSEETIDQLSGIWRELALYIKRLLRQKDQKNKHDSDQLNHLLNAISVSPNGVLLLDHQHRIEWCNPAAAEHFGLDQTRDIGQHITNLIRNPEFITYLEIKQYHTALKISSSKGNKQLSIQIHPYDQSRLLLLSRDISQIEQTDKMRKEFVANVSHELRTPLTVIAGFIETLQTLPLNDEERTRYLGLMGAQSIRMQSLINDLLTLARLEDSPLPPFNTGISVSAMMNHAQNTAQELSKEQHNLIFNTINDAQIAGIESELLSALANIVVNAVKYTPPKGKISVTFQISQNGEGCFQIKDTGQGIAKEHLSHLTERFYRIDKSRSRDTGGTGLGLSIVKHVLIRHGGRLLIESVEGKGSTFSLIFPADRIKITP